MKQGSVVLVVLFILVFLPSCEITDDEGFTLQEAAAGLREGLVECAVKTVSRLGAEDGYYADDAVKVLLPQEARDVVGEVKNATSFSLSFVTYSMSEYINVDQFETRIITSMNRAAEAAAADDDTLSTFRTVIADLDLESAFELLTGNVYYRQILYKEGEYI